MNWLKVLVGFSAILVAGCAAYFSVTGLGVLFAGASVSVMVMAGALEMAKLVAATYLKQEWDTIKGFNKWYLTISVGTLMLITSAGIFGYLSNAFQQQNLSLQKVERDIAVYQSQIERNESEIARYTTQLTNQQNIRNSQEENISKVVERNGSTSRLTQMVRNADKEIATISQKIDELSKQNNVALDSINTIKNNNIELEREVGGFRFVAEAFGVPLNSVVKFFILIIVLVFDPLAVALIIAFNGLIMRRKEEDGIDVIIDDGGISDILKKEKEYEVYGDKEKQREAIIEMMKGDEELGLYDEPNEALVEAAQQYEAEKKNEIDSTTTNVEENKIDKELFELKQDISRRPIDLDGDGAIDGWDTDGDGLIDEIAPNSSNRRIYAATTKPYYANSDFDWNDRKQWINDQNAVNYWFKHIRNNDKYPTDFESKTY